MAGRGGAQAPDYAPRPPAGPGAMANRQDMTTGATRQQTGMNRHPAVPVTGNDGPYGQRTQLEQLAGGAARAGVAPPGRPPAAGRGAKAPPGLLDQLGGGQEQEEFLPPVAPLAGDAFAAYDPAMLRQLEQLLPIFTQMAADPSAGPEVALLAQLAADVIMHNQEVLAAPPPTWLGPAPERQGV